MTNEQKNFYIENQEFLFDIKEYYEIMRKEFSHIINEVSGHSLKIENFYIGMIPLKPNINGLLLDSEKIKEFECDDIRVEIGSSLPTLKEIAEFERKNYFYYENDQLNIKKCQIYYESKEKFPFIRRHGGCGNSSGHRLIQSKLKTITNNNALFVSKWIEFGPFCVFFVSELNEATCLKYWEFANIKEDNNTSYKFFLNTLIDNFFEKWLEYVYYGLYHSTINYISDTQAIIAASANDMFESRQIPTEHVFTKIANYEYEGAPCRGKIVFTDRVDDIVCFEQPVALSIDNVKKIRKMLEMSNEKTCLIATRSGNEIVGLDDFKNHKESYLLEFLDANMWELSCGGKHIVKYLNGQYRLPEKKLDCQLLLKKCDEKFKKEYNEDIVKVIEVASCQKHGTMVIISPTAEKESKELVKEGKGIAIHKRNLIEESNDLVLGLCSIDGAFMIDPFGNCTGIGLILSNPNSGKGNPERGSRYNSAVNYINNNKSSIAVVISEDGMIDIL